MELEDRLKRNISVLYAFSFCWLALVIIPVVVPFFTSKGLSLAGPGPGAGDPGRLRRGPGAGEDRGSPPPSHRHAPGAR